MSRLNILVGEQLAKSRVSPDVTSAAGSCMWRHLAALLLTTQEVPGPPANLISTTSVS